MQHNTHCGNHDCIFFSCQESAYGSSSHQRNGVMFWYGSFGRVCDRTIHRSIQHYHRFNKQVSESGRTSLLNISFFNMYSRLMINKYTPQSLSGQYPPTIVRWHLLCYWTCLDSRIQLPVAACLVHLYRICATITCMSEYNSYFTLKCSP